MNPHRSIPAHSDTSDFIVHRPRPADAIGKSLRCAFDAAPPDSEFDALLRMLDKVPVRH